ncbi:MAG: DUF3990 domain-containing protein, partial [Butyrivibrio sp.]|nr:DUF3990 domain-containing protein [Butyrivibrio sp.]
MNNKITLYHGTDHIIEKPQFGFGKLYNDYGLAFYCTKSKSLACEWAVTEDSDGYANEYILNTENLKFLNLNKVPYPVLTWLTVLIQNRTFDSYNQVQSSAKDFLMNNFNIDYESYDVIVGYRADDSYFQFAKAFLNNGITYKTLSNAMYLGELGNQYAIKSENAFSKLTFTTGYKAPASIWFEKKIARENKAREIYANSK